MFASQKIKMVVEYMAWLKIQFSWGNIFLEKSKWRENLS
jgi:hypothetical protein